MKPKAGPYKQVEVRIELAWDAFKRDDRKNANRYLKWAAEIMQQDERFRLESKRGKAVTAKWHLVYEELDKAGAIQ